jgi:hypothetical protein
MFFYLQLSLFFTKQISSFFEPIVVYFNSDACLLLLEHDANKQAERIECRVVVQLTKACGVNQPF